MLLSSVPPGVLTRTFPEVAPAGTLATRSVGPATLKTAAVPLNVTLLAAFRLVPRISTCVPTLAEAGKVSTNGARPMESLKNVPHYSRRLPTT
jgi:hypothetical protein